MPSAAPEPLCAPHVWRGAAAITCATLIFLTAFFRAAPSLASRRARERADGAARLRDLDALHGVPVSVEPLHLGAHCDRGPPPELALDEEGAGGSIPPSRNKLGTLGAKVVYNLKVEDPVPLVILVNSARDHVSLRAAIKQTWGAHCKALGVPIYFYMGEDPTQPALPMKSGQEWIATKPYVQAKGAAAAAAAGDGASAAGGAAADAGFRGDGEAARVTVTEVDEAGGGSSDDEVDSLGDETRLFQIHGLPETHQNRMRKTQIMLEHYMETRQANHPVAFVAKVDDDVYVDVAAVLGRLAMLELELQEDFAHSKERVRVDGGNDFELEDRDPELAVLKTEAQALMISGETKSEFLGPSKPDGAHVLFGHMVRGRPLVTSPSCKGYDGGIAAQLAGAREYWMPKGHHDHDDGYKYFPDYADSSFWVMSVALLDGLSRYGRAHSRRIHGDASPWPEGQPSAVAAFVKGGLLGLPSFENEGVGVALWLQMAFGGDFSAPDADQVLTGSPGDPARRVHHVHDEMICTSRSTCGRFLADTADHGGTRSHRLTPGAFFPDLAPPTAHAEVDGMPITLHLPWTQAQHVGSSLTHHEVELQNADLLRAAHLNMHLEGAPFGECLEEDARKQRQKQDDDVVARLRGQARAPRALLYAIPDGSVLLAEEWEAEQKCHAQVRGV